MDQQYSIWLDNIYNFLNPTLLPSNAQAPMSIPNRGPLPPATCARSRSCLGCPENAFTNRPRSCWKAFWVFGGKSRLRNSSTRLVDGQLGCLTRKLGLDMYRPRGSPGIPAAADLP